MSFASLRGNKTDRRGFWVALASTTVAATASVSFSYWKRSFKSLRPSKKKTIRCAAAADKAKAKPSRFTNKSEVNPLVQELFHQCVTHMRSVIPKLPQTHQLELYALYKQAT